MYSFVIISVMHEDELQEVYEMKVPPPHPPPPATMVAHMLNTGAEGVHQESTLAMMHLGVANHNNEANPNSAFGLVPTLSSNSEARTKHILVVEDNATTQKQMRTILNEAGYIVDVAGNGKEALQNISCVNYDVCLMDFLMPVLDGLQATAMIRAQESAQYDRLGYLRQLPIIGVTSRGLDDSMKYGMNECLMKPVTSAKLLHIVRKWIHPNEPATTHRQAEDHKWRVLLVENNTASQLAAQRMLEIHGCTVLCASNGAEAVDMVEAEEEREFDLILLDIHMPIMHGVAATTRILQIVRQRGHARPPIFGMTTNCTAEMLQECYSAGMAKVVVKPLTSKMTANWMTTFQRKPTCKGKAMCTLSKLQVLLVEDSPVESMFASRMLEGMECVVTVVRDGQQAVKYVVEHPHNIDLVLMDIQSTFMDGMEATLMMGQHYEFLSQQARDFPAPRMPMVVGLIADGTNLDTPMVQQGLSAGMTRRVVKRLLEGKGAKCTLADNGEQCLQTLQGRRDTFDLVLMDCHMPVMDGWTATQKIRELEEEMVQTGPLASFKRIPIVAFTTDTMQSDVEKCYHVGMDDYLQKPIKLPQHLNTIAKWTLKVEPVVPPRASSCVKKSAGPLSTGPVRLAEYLNHAQTLQPPAGWTKQNTQNAQKMRQNNSKNETAAAQPSRDGQAAELGRSNAPPAKKVDQLVQWLVDSMHNEYLTMRDKHGCIDGAAAIDDLFGSFGMYCEILMHLVESIEEHIQIISSALPEGPRGATPEQLRMAAHSLRGACIGCSAILAAHLCNDMEMALLHIPNDSQQWTTAGSHLRIYLHDCMNCLMTELKLVQQLGRALKESKHKLNIDEAMTRFGSCRTYMSQLEIFFFWCIDQVDVILRAMLEKEDRELVVELATELGNEAKELCLADVMSATKKLADLYRVNISGMTHDRKTAFLDLYKELRLHAELAFSIMFKKQDAQATVPPAPGRNQRQQIVSGTLGFGPSRFGLEPAKVMHSARESGEAALAELMSQGVANEPKHSNGGPVEKRPRELPRAGLDHVDVLSSPRKRSCR
ncbi:hypothetical protein CYMTET_10517 [Cymbomonas tetramitiformis]|uniref:Response regulatory domain-containing protein n=1 Tax=Cymbomonas tetramitiformis TaxID=36881 RepID=A0AAE0GPD7_9CHLO|nr:hypothetical protein CYMTET_10517 [Cymbomonas tetramitiformis]